MRIQNLFLTVLFLSATTSFAQDSIQVAQKVIVDNGNTHAEMVTTEWGGSHGIFFGSKIHYTGSDNLWGNGNAVYSNASGPYSFGAFSFGYIANGGTFGFYDGGLSTGADHPITWQPVMMFPRGGNVGIGTANPLAKLHVNGDLMVNTYLRVGTMPASTNGQFRILGQEGIGSVDPASNRTAYLWASGETFGISAFDYNASEPLPLTVNFENTNTYINSNGGQVVIGSHAAVPAGYKLGVDGNIIAKKIKVQQQPWADYVFEQEYKLPTLKEVESFIQANKHLPGVPSAKEIEKEGLDLGDGQANLLKKIEELTLYAIDQEKRISAAAEKEKVLQQQLTAQQQKQKQQQLELEILKKQIHLLLNKAVTEK